MNKPAIHVEEVQPGCTCGSAGNMSDYERGSALVQKFAPLGGVSTDQEIVASLRCGRSQPLSTLARWIVDRDVLHFRWQSTIYLPRFQFVADEGTTGRSPMRGMRQLLAELDCHFDDLEAAEWFATPNTWLFASEPATMVAFNVDLVLQAARTARFISRGWC